MEKGKTGLYPKQRRRVELRRQEEKERREGVEERKLKGRDQE